MRVGIGMLLCGAVTVQIAVSPAPLTLVRSIELPHVDGRIDHLAVDPATQRLYVAALGNNTVEVLDLKTGTHLRSVPGFREPQGIAVAAETSAVAVANGQGEGLLLMSADDYRQRAVVRLGDVPTTFAMTGRREGCMSDTATARWRRSILPRASCSVRRRSQRIRSRFNWSATDRACS